MKKIIFAIVGAGGGHKMPAIAVYESMQALYSNQLDLRLMDFMQEIGCGELDKKHKEMWKFYLRHPLWARIVH